MGHGKVIWRVPRGGQRCWPPVDPCSHVHTKEYPSKGVDFCPVGAADGKESAVFLTENGGDACCGFSGFAATPTPFGAMDFSTMPLLPRRAWATLQALLGIAPSADTAAARDLALFPASPNKILCISHDAGFYGAQLLALHIARYLKEQIGLEVTTVLLGDGPLRDEFAHLGPVIDFTSPSWRTMASPKVLAKRRTALRKLARAGYRHALCNSAASGGMLPLLNAEGFKTVALVHELPNLLHEYGLLQAATDLGRLAATVVFPADFVRKKFLSVVPVDAERTAILPQGLFRPNPHRHRRHAARAELLSQLGLGSDASLVVAAGSSDRRKGLDIFVRVAADVVRKLPLAHFIWIGSDQTELARECSAWVVESGLSANVHFLGVLQDPDLYARRIAAADLYLLSSREDPFPSVVLDAMTVGVPVIGFAGAGGFDSLLGEGAGMLVPLEDSKAMAGAVCDVLTNAEQAAAMGAAGQAIIDARFQFGDYVRALLRIVGIPRPRISVIVPNYNYARYLPERLASIVGQSYRPFEIIFLDDCSSDDSVAVATTLLRDAGIAHQIVANSSNAGCYAQWLKGLALARGELVWIAEADDSCDSRLLEALVAGFDDADVTLAYCQSRKINGEGRVIRQDYRDYTDAIDPAKWLTPYLRKGTDEIRDTLAIKNTIPNASAVLMRKPRVYEISERLLGHKNAGDWMFYVHLLETGSVYFTPQVLNSHRLHVQSVTKGSNLARHFSEILLVQEYIRSRHPLTEETTAKIEAMRKFTFEYLKLNTADHPVYRQHPAALAAMGLPPRSAQAPVPDAVLPT